MKRSLVGAATVAAGVIALVAAMPAEAQQCAVSKQKGRFAKLLGGVGEGLANVGLGKIGVHNDAEARNTMRDFMSDGLACMLSPAEQARAAASTEAAVNKGVGGKSAWKSETRTGVSGKSEVTGQTKSADGTVCRSVTQVVTVDGEEKTEVEQLCKAPGASGFTRKA